MIQKKRSSIYLLTMLSLMLLSPRSYSQTGPAADRGGEVVVEEVNEARPKKTFRDFTNISSIKNKSSRKSFRGKRLGRKKARNLIKKSRDEWYAWALAILGIVIMIAGLIIGMALFAAIGWWAVLVAFGALIVGMLIAFLGGALDCCGRLSGLGMYLVGILGAVAGLFVMAIWGIVGFFVWLF